MTHIVVISTSFPLDNSGAEAAASFVADFVRELSKRVEVTVLALYVLKKFNVLYSI